MRLPRPHAVIVALLLLVVAGCSDPSTGTPPAPSGSEPAADSSSSSPTPAPPAPSAASTVAAVADLDQVELGLEPVVELEQPTALATRAGDERALYIAERTGRIVRVVNGGAEDQAVLDISSQTVAEGERGLLGLSFSSDGNLLYASYTDRNGDSRLDEYRMRGQQADAASARALLFVEQPYTNHNGGNIVTGPDGLLYYGLGDGGSAGDPHGNGQDRSTLLGKLLRIDPRRTGDAPYRIPENNPFIDDGNARPEIWVYGLRNPWRFSFDRETDDLWIGDVGQGDIEEIDRLPFEQAAGANLGWNVFEGTQRFSDGDAPGAVPPIYEYPHDGRCSVTGGYVYRGTQIAGLVGAYLYGDYCDGVLRAVLADGDRITDERDFDAEVPQLASFGEDASGELYALSLSGPVYRLVARG